MSKPFTKHIAFLLFVIFMTNIGVWGFSAARLAHEVEHNGKVEQAAASHQHAQSHHADDAADDDAPDVSEHQTLHAVDHLQLFDDTALSGAFAPSMASVASSHFTEQTLPLPNFDLPFRPPRSGAFPA
jgi:hypothetical protein